MDNNQVPHFFKEIRDRLKLQFFPFNDLYTIYLIFFVLVIGGIGIWVSILQEFNKETFNIQNITLNSGTYYLVLITTSYIDITTNEKIVNKKSLQVYSFILLFIIALIFTLTFFVSFWWAVFLSILGILIALFIWHLANCDNDKFNDESYNQKMRQQTKKRHGNNWPKRPDGQ